MDYAVLATGGKQYRVRVGETLVVEKLNVENGQKVIFDKVLLLVEENEVKIGTPYLKDTVVEAKVIKHKKGKKIRVARFRAKSRHRRVIGHRQSLTEVFIEKIKSKKALKTTSEKKPK